MNHNVIGKKELYVEDFSVIDSLVRLDKEYKCDKRSTDQVLKAEGVYVYRAHLHEPEESGLIKWLTKQPDLLFYSEAIVSFTTQNVQEILLPKNNELVMYLKFDE